MLGLAGGVNLAKPRARNHSSMRAVPGTSSAAGVPTLALPGSAGDVGIISSLLPPHVSGAAFLGLEERREWREKD